MGNITTTFKTSKAKHAPTSEKVLISPELDHLCTLLMAHKDLRVIFSQYFVEADWISLLLEHIPNEVSQSDQKHHISYLLPTGGFLFVTDDRNNLYKSRRAMRASLQNQKSLSRTLSSKSITVSKSVSSNSSRSRHGRHEPLALKPSLLVLAAALRTFATSPEIMYWQNRQKEMQSTAAKKAGISSVRFFSFKSTRSSSVVPVDDSVGHEDEASTAPVQFTEREKNDGGNCDSASPFTTKQLVAQLNFHSSSAEVFMPRHLPEAPHGSPVGNLSRASSAVFSSPTSSVMNGHSTQRSTGPVANMTTCTHENLRLVLVDGIRSLCPPPSDNVHGLAPVMGQRSRTNSHDQVPTNNSSHHGHAMNKAPSLLVRQLTKDASTHSMHPSSSKSNISELSPSPSGYFNADSVQDEVQKLLSSKKWLQDLVDYLTEELPFSMTISEPPVLSTEDNESISLFTTTNGSLYQCSDASMSIVSDPATVPKPSNATTKTHQQQDKSIASTPGRVSYYQKEGSTFSYIFANKAFEELTGFSRTQVLGQSMQVLAHESCTESNQLQKINEAQQEGRLTKLAMTIMRKDGVQCYDLLAVRPVISINGEYVASVAIHYPLAGNEETFPEDLQAVDVLLNLVSTILA